MGSLFEIAKSGIQAYRQALSVTGQNIANVNTEGYSKRDVSLEELGGIQGGVTDVSDQTGLGVRVDEIRRSFNAYVNERLRNSHSGYEQLNQFSKEVALLENTLLPTGSDLSTFIGKFFSSLQEIAAAPEDSAPRTVAMEAGKDMVNSFNDYSTRLKLSQEGAFSQSKLSIDKINLLSNELASVNNRLKSAGATKTANDLLDTRDLLLENLSKDSQKTFEKNPFEELEFVHVVRPRTIYNERKADKKSYIIICVRVKLTLYTHCSATPPNCVWWGGEILDMVFLVGYKYLT